MKNKTIADIKKIMLNEKIDDTILNKLRLDDRKGVQNLVKTYDKRIEQEQKLKRQCEEMMSFDREYYTKGFRYVAGVDEAGRGPLAGPVVAAAVILPYDFMLLGLTDSKLLNEEKRNEFYDIIVEQAISYGIAIIDNETIDEINILEATKQAMRASLDKLMIQPDCVLLDAVELASLPYHSESIIKGDAKSISIAAASILAKVTRDQMMKEIHQEYPIYHFESNMGYGTKHHLKMLEKNGISSYHRKTFAPVQENM